MREVARDAPILTINEVAAILRCSKTHVSHLLAGKVRGLPRLTHIAMGRRKLVRREWLDQWIENNKRECAASGGK
ncbi:MAG: helix-turn-helix domain-containing protein [Acidobacteriia bacterium]|nr:helix-turn-helix domain-containing protein [Terriglobia bacterium]